MTHRSGSDEAAPVTIRTYAQGRKGATAFFRNRPFLQELTAILDTQRNGPCRVLFHACSVGAEPYSFALWCLRRGLLGAPCGLEISATDIEPRFMAVAKRGVYPAAVLEGMTPEERSWFEPHPEGVRVPADGLAMVRFLPPTSFIDADPGVEFDAVLIMNALTYVTPVEQHTAILRAGGYTRRVLGLTAFHPDTIKEDVSAAGFAPVRRSQEAIHEAWGDRLTDDKIVPDSPEYSWRLPHYDARAADADYRFCSLFARAEPSSD